MAVVYGREVMHEPLLWSGGARQWAWSLLLRELGLGSKPAGALTVAWRIHPPVVW